MLKNIITFLILNICFSHIIFSQNVIDCSELKNKIINIQKENKSIRIGYWSRSRTLYIDYEQDSKTNKHLIYRNTGKDNVKYAMVSVNNKAFFSKGENDWKEKPLSKFNHSSWIDSCNQVNKVFEKSFNSCKLDREVNITGVPYSVFSITIEIDTFDIWVNKTNNKIDKIKGENKLKDIKLEWYYDLPFEIIEPALGVEKVYNYGFSIFPPSYSDYEDLDGNTPVFNIVDKLPVYKGGQGEMFRTIGANLKYPTTAIKKNIEGTVYIGFVVEPDGKMTNFKLKRGINEECNEEAIRVLKLLSGNWEAGVFKGQKVRVAYTLPIKYKLE